MKLYHGTTVPGIKTLKAQSKGGILYLTDNPAYALFYIRDREIDFVTCGVGRDGKVFYDEKFPNQLQYLYQGRQGYLYEAEASASPGKVDWIFVTQGDVPVTNTILIHDAYEAIQKEIHRGNVILLPYEQLTPEQKMLNQQGIEAAIRAEQNISPVKAEFYREFFPEAWENALAQMP